MRIRLLITVFFIASIFLSKAQKPTFTNYLHDQWVDSLMQKMSLDARIGQLFMIQAFSNKDSDHVNQVLKDVEQFQVGGVIFMGGHPVAQVRLNNKLQAASKIPLLVATDAESGLSFRLDSTMKYPVQMALGAVENDSLIYQMGKEIGEQCKRIGIHINFAPVADLNSNPENPVINWRSLGENRDAVARKAWLISKGMQDAGVIACAKHFPGHGDTGTDSHFTLPVIKNKEKDLDSTHIYPFKYLIDQGIGAIMSAHLQIPSMEPNAETPSSLSKKIIQKKLIDKLQFSGLIITDGMNMRGITKNYSSGKSAVMAIQAGNDILEIIPNLPEAIKAVKKAIASGELKEADINAKCRKILAAKRWLGLQHYQPVKEANLHDDLNKKSYLVTQRALYAASISTLKNKGNILPLQRLDSLKIATLSIGMDSISSFQKMLRNYVQMDHFVLAKDADTATVSQTMRTLKNYNLIITGIHNMKLTPSKKYGLSDAQLKAISLLDLQKSIVAFFGNPYALHDVPELEDARALLVCYQENTEIQELTAQAIFGAIGTNGKLPVTVDSQLPLNTGLETKKVGRLAYSFPENVGIKSAYLVPQIDSIVQVGLDKKAFPGCQVLVAKNGEIIFSKNYGYFTFDQKTPVQKESMYDFASVTKVTGGLPTIMKLYDDGKIKLDTPITNYWPDFKGSDKAKLTLREFLTHQAGLKPGLPFIYNLIAKDSKLCAQYIKDHPTEKFSNRISSHLYADNHLPDKIYTEIRNTPLLKERKYVYSDQFFYMVPAIVKRLTCTDFETYLQSNFYRELGAKLMYRPYLSVPVSCVAPTEEDFNFRKELMQGFVHDEGAALLGGISGNAGLFGSANELAKLIQMYLQFGYYGGKQFIQTSTMKEFTKTQFPDNGNRRGLGFDKPLLNNKTLKLKDAYPAIDASSDSFGHSGFTGTFVWADPKYQIVYIFLSNRVYPTRENSGLSDLNIRISIHQAIYDSIKKSGIKH